MIYRNIILSNSSTMLLLIFHNTPLHVAVQNENIDIIQVLLNHKNIDVDITDHIYYMISSNYISCFMVLCFIFEKHLFN